MSKKRLFSWAVVLLFVLSALFITGYVGKADMPAVYISNNFSFPQKHASDELSRYWRWLSISNKPLAGQMINKV